MCSVPLGLTVALHCPSCKSCETSPRPVELSSVCVLGSGGNAKCLVATIHQPRSDIWKLADNVTLLARGGVVTVSLSAELSSGH